MASGPREWNLLDTHVQMALSAFPSVLVVNKFGYNAAVGTSEEDVWAAGGKETLPTSGVSMFFSCTDNSNGVGQSILITGLDENWEDKQTTVVLDGQTKTAIPGSWTRIFRAYQVSAEPDPVGDIYIYEDDTVVAGVPQTASKIHAFVDFTDAAQITQKCMYTVPYGKEGVLRWIHTEMGAITSGSARSADVAIEVQTLALGATVENPSWTPWRRVIAHNLSNGANSDDTWLEYPTTYPELTNIHLRAKATATSEIHGEFTLLIVPKRNE